MRRPFLLLLPLVLVGNVQAYFPPDCLPAHAIKDYTDSDAVVIARVIKIERKISDFTLGGKKIKSVSYMATLKVARSVRGEFKKDDEYVLCDGGYFQKEENNLDIQYVGQCGTHARAGFQPDGIYVLFLKQHRGDDGEFFWAPRSCHRSIHKVEQAVDEKTEIRSLIVRESLGHSGETKPPVALDAFLKAKKSEAEAEVKAETQKPTK